MTHAGTTLAARVWLSVVTGIGVSLAIGGAAHSQPGKLGDLSSFKSIVTEVEAISAKGDFVAAGKRITDFETAWDQAEPALKPLNKKAWHHVDDAADAALDALRASSPDAQKVTNTLSALEAALDDP